ncbi:hypothetical protein O4H49_10400 [Kiloniella laminariae]|uniref:Uncharacterized protein n=1 Tax=Kiloniella laminariae TaxID=454162 RepID=A0ABT4LJC4_9PROT|nr:hypothetical protein [Kiloniella laminariae]MCZ4281189.1 hypothetical protein [Kiloniella laminariae]
MSKPIKITVSGTDHRGGDAPTVEDLLAQIQDFVFVLHGVEDAVSDGEPNEIVWRVTNATKNSPLTFEVTPTPRKHAMNVDRRAEKVVQATAKGFRQLYETGERPAYFTDQVVDRAAKVYERVTNGLSTTIVDFCGYDDAPIFEASPDKAREVARKLDVAKRPAAIAHRELGSLEGFISKVELDGFGRPLVWLKSRMDGQLVKCISDAKGLDRIGHFEVSEVLKGLRVRVHGLLHYKDLEQIASIEVEGVHVFEPDNKLPNHDEIIAPNFTDGVEASEYLRRLHSDG